MRLTGRLFLVTALLVGFALAACVTVPPAKPIANLQDIAGQWEGWGAGPGGTATASVDFKADGTYTWSVTHGGGTDKGTGTWRIDDGRMHWVSSSGRKGEMTLHEGEGRRVLKSRTYDRAYTLELEPAK